MDPERVELVQPHYGPVNAYRVGDTLVDTGHVCAASRERLQDTLDGGPLAGIERVVLTHPHIDHVGGSLSVPDVTTLPHVLFEGAESVVREYDRYVADAREATATIAAPPGTTPTPETSYFPDYDYATEALNVERVVGPGDTVRLGSHECEVVHTPGHCRQHMSLFDPGSGVMLSGDAVSRNGHFMFSPLFWDLAAYRTGLERVRAREPERLLPGHGEPMDDPADRVADELDKADATEAAILAAVETAGRLSARELAREALGATEATVDFLSSAAAAYAIHLAAEGRLRVERTPGVVAYSG